MEQLLNLLQLLKSLLNHEGIAYVFEDIEDLKENIDKPDLPVTKDYHSCFKRVRTQGLPWNARGWQYANTQSAC